MVVPVVSRRKLLRGGIWKLNGKMVVPPGYPSRVEKKQMLLKWLTILLPIILIKNRLLIGGLRSLKTSKTPHQIFVWLISSIMHISTLKQRKKSILLLVVNLEAMKVVLYFLCVLYGLKSSGAAWRSHFADLLWDLLFQPNYADPEFRHRPARPMVTHIMSIFWCMLMTFYVFQPTRSVFSMHLKTLHSNTV